MTDQTPSPQSVVGRLAARAWTPGDDLPEVGSRALVSGANADVESDQHRAFSWRTVVGYGEGDSFVCLQTEGCWPTIERTTNCWFAEIEKPRVRAAPAPSSLAGGEWRPNPGFNPLPGQRVDIRWGGDDADRTEDDGDLSDAWSWDLYDGEDQTDTIQMWRPHVAALSPEAPARAGGRS